MAPTLNKEFLDIQANYRVLIHSELVRDMIITYSQMHRTDNYSQHISVVWPVWLNGWVFVYQLTGCGFESHWYHLNLNKEFFDSQGIIQCRFILKHVRDMIITNKYRYSFIKLILQKNYLKIMVQQCFLLLKSSKKLL